MRSSTRLFINGEAASQTSGEPLEGRDTIPDIQHRTNIGTYLGKAVSWAGSIQGDLGEVLIYNKALGDSERLGIEGHLAEKYGMSLKAFNHFAPRARFSEKEKSFWA